MINWSIHVNLQLAGMRVSFNTNSGNRGKNQEGEHLLVSDMKCQPSFYPRCLAAWHSLTTFTIGWLLRSNYVRGLQTQQKLKKAQEGAYRNLTRGRKQTHPGEDFLLGSLSLCWAYSERETWQRLSVWVNWSQMNRSSSLNRPGCTGQSREEGKSDFTDMKEMSRSQTVTCESRK